MTRITQAGVETQLTNGDALTQTDRVITADKGSVVLVFMNGSTVRVAPNTDIKIDRFEMDPLAAAIDLSKLTEEPSPSKTELNLAFGEIVGNVKKLKTTSNYSIKTPVGAAGIRGTTFRIVFRPTGDGRAFNFQVTTAEGLVVFEGTTAGSGAPVEIPADQEIVVVVNVENGQAAITGPVNAQQISAEAQQQIQQAVTQVTEAAQQTNFTPGPPPTTPPPQTPPVGDPPPPPPTTPPPVLTGGGQG